MDFKKLFSKKALMIVLPCLAALLIFITVLVLVKNSRSSAVLFESITSSENESLPSKLLAKDKNARKGIIKDNGEARFAFTEIQKDAFSQIYQENKSAALVIRMQFYPDEEEKELLTMGVELPFNFGILYQEDFDARGRLKEALTEKISVYADLGKKLSYADSEPVIIDLSMALPKSEHFTSNLPEGFFIKSSIRCKLLSVCAAPALLGFDRSKDIAFFGFASNGGLVNFQYSSLDFSGASLTFPVQNTKNSFMPQIVIGLSEDEKFLEKTCRVTIGGEKLYVKKVDKVSKLEFPSSALKSPFSQLEFSNDSEMINSFLMQASSLYSEEPELVKYKAIKTDPGLILNFNQQNWRQEEYEVFEWDRFPGILFFDIADYAIQDNFFRRLAYYVEKRGYKGKLWSDEVLAGKHAYNAHDYSSESLANFFNQATKENFPLCKEELILKDILIANGLLIPEGQLVKAGEGGLVSISRQTAAYTRSYLMAHEAWHTLFFRDEAFRNFVAAVYYTFDPDSRQFLIDFFQSQESLGYDTEDEYLMHNEFMAYIMQQSIANVPDYFVGRANLYSVRVFTPELAAYVRATNAKGFEDAAVILNDYTYDTYGITGGNVALINR